MIIKTILTFLITGVLFLGTVRGQNYGTFYDKINGEDMPMIMSLESDGASGVWIGYRTGNIISHFVNGQFTNYTLPDLSSGTPNTVYEIVRSDDGLLYIATNMGVLTFDGNNFNELSELSGIKVYSIYIDENNTVWFGSYGNGLYSYDGNNWSNYSSVSYIVSVSKDGDVIIVSGDGLYRFDGNDFTPIDGEFQKVFTLNKDNYNQIWVTMWYQGDMEFGKIIGDTVVVVKRLYTDYSVYFVNYDSRSSEFIFDSENNMYGIVGDGAHIDKRGFYKLNTTTGEIDFFPKYTTTYCVENVGNTLYFGCLYYDKENDATKNGLLVIDDFENTLEQAINYNRTQPNYLNINNWNVRFGETGWNFYAYDYIAAAEIPKDSGKHSLFISQLWIGGYADTILHVTAERYEGGDFFVGPIANVRNNEFFNRYDRVWKVNKSDIDYHISHYGYEDYHMPESIKNWPGNGNLSNGELPVTAPYVDVNQNGIYDPENGDYPKIRGDQTIYIIYNDSADVHNSSYGEKLGIEVHAMAYAFADSTNPNYNTFYVNYYIYNRSDNVYDSLYVGIFNDMDLGNPFDDYIGCDSTRNAYFLYNGDDNDENYNGVNGYGENPPAVAVVALNHPLSSFMYFINGTGPLSTPNTATEYYNYLTARWRDGTHLTYGGDGYGDSIYTNFMFEQTTGWNEISAGNVPGDRRGIGSVGPFTLRPEGYVDIDVAYVWARDSVNHSLDTLMKAIDYVQNFYNTQNFDCLLAENFYVSDDTTGIVDSVFAYTQNCSIDYSIPVDSAYMTNIVENEGIITTDWVIWQAGDSIVIPDIKYYVDSVGNNMFYLTIVCNSGDTGDKTLHVILVSDSYTAQTSIYAQEVEFKSQVILYPNPTNNYVYIVSNMSNYEVLVQNVNGKMIMKKQNVKQINLSGMTKGVYFITISDKMQKITKKIILQ